MTAFPAVLVDENIPRAVVAELARAGVDTICAADTSTGVNDEFLLAWASREKWVLVTGDLDFPRLIFAENRAPPLVLIVERRQPCDALRLAQDVLRVLRLRENMHGHVVVFDGDDERVRAFPH